MSDAIVLGLPIEQRNARLASLAEVLRSSLWVIPVAFLVVVVALAQLLVTLDPDPGGRTWWLFSFSDDVDSATVVLTTIATSMLTLLAVVFPLTIVALQLASSQFSPRVMRRFVRDWITQATFGAFVATFVYALLVLRTIEPATVDAPAFVPDAAVSIAVIWVWLSLGWFVVFVHHIVQSIRVVNIIEAVAKETRQAIEQNAPLHFPYLDVERPELGEPDQIITFDEAAGTLDGMETDRLVRAATEADVVLVLRCRVGDYLPTGLPVIEVHGGRCTNTAHLLSAFEIGPERTMYQDVGFGFRQLVDIAAKALSPAVNDPTTATQVLDRIEDLLHDLGRRPMSPSIYLDQAGDVRMLRPRAAWDDYVLLSFTEIRRFGAESAQVCRRLSAVLTSLEQALPDERCAPLEAQRTLLRRSVERHFLDAEDRAVALTPNRQGLG